MRSVLTAPVEFIFVDLETTGLDADKEFILEFGIALCDRNLNKMAQNSWLVTERGYQDALRNAHPAVKGMHSESGLMNELNKHNYIGVMGDTKCVALEVEEWLIGFGIEPGKFEMAGNSIGFDRAFIARHMPQLLTWFHYRNADVSTVKVLVKKYLPEVAAAHEANRPKEKAAHRAMADIDDSIAELKYYLVSLGMLKLPVSV